MKISERLNINTDSNYHYSSYKKGGLEIVRVKNKHAQLEMSLHGAQVLSYIPNAQKDLLWMSTASELRQGKAIRGGIPLCFPWFGPHEKDETLPQHGFARLINWELVNLNELEGDETRLILALQSSDYTKQFWPFDFKAELEVIIGAKLAVSLKIKNVGSETFTYSSALHSYFNIGDINKAFITGLKDTCYYWGFESIKQKQNEKLLVIEEEENRRYVNTAANCSIIDPTYEREIVVSKVGSQVTVVWNPWIENSKSMKDMNDGDYKNFVCVEAGNYYNDCIELAPGDTHTTSTVILSKYTKSV